MRAEDALKLTNESITGPAIQEFVDQIITKIKAAASQGQRSVDMFQGLKPHPSAILQGALKNHFRALGYEVEDHPDPDPGHPCSRPYTSLEW